MTRTFSHFVGIDWSGAKGKRHAGLAIAVCPAGNEAPSIVAPPSGNKNWSRSEIGDWIAGGMELPSGTRALIGIDSAFSLPFIDEGAYLPCEMLPDAAPDLWPFVDQKSAGAADLFAGPFVEAFADHYHRPSAKGKRYKRRMRVTETLAVTSGAGPCESVFHLIGPSQVGLSGLSTVRMLARLHGQNGISIWPYEEPDGDTVLVEIYAAAFAKLGGHRGKIKGLDDLNTVLGSLNSQKMEAMPDTAREGEHAADAIVTAAGLRIIACERKYWHPDNLSTKVRRTEGWIFGIL
ncbi:MAG: hypothetical protein JJ850_15795 [Kordiimonadaceae bacterium]|nr:hypothetical protein [Kordiimonadaceae bacterium]MBO6569819.1 hypothetical protein [Kordiimonadaceae bacterium]MBO6966085.1 hypothetical protein [Kordiimonadaceae bacterium]